MAEAVLITTDDLEPAVRLRAAFEANGLRVELLAPGEGLADALAEPLLVVITGGLRDMPRFDRHHLEHRRCDSTTTACGLSLRTVAFSEFRSPGFPDS